MTVKKVSIASNIWYLCTERGFDQWKFYEKTVERAMLTKKEKLLIYPWQQQRYHQHRKKVQSAGPAIDFYPPNDYPHITAKLKKMQKESERQDKVNKDNIRLLQRLVSH